MEISTTTEGTTSTIAPTGDVDLSCSRDLQVAIKETMESKPERVIIDLAGVPYMDSSGVATLVEAMKISRTQSTKLVLCGLQEKVLSIFEIARLDKVFTITDDAATAASV